VAYVTFPGDGAVTPDYVRSGRYQVNVSGQVCEARVSLRPPFDPDGERVRSSRSPAGRF